MKQWLALMRKTIQVGCTRPDRTGVGTIATFGEQISLDNSDTFPAVTAKKLGMGQCMAELACFINGCDSLAQFHEMGCNIWDGNGEAKSWVPRAPFAGSLGRIYGVNWRGFRSARPTGSEGALEVWETDQLKNLVDGLKNNPFSRRHLVLAYNPGELDEVCLPACHVLFQCFVRPYCTTKFLDLRVDMRSVDLFLGLPFDIASYAVLQRLLAKEAGMLSGRLVFHMGDSHVYLNHFDQVRQVLGRTPMPPPKLSLAPEATLFGFLPGQATLENYRSHSAVPAPLNVEEAPCLAK